MHVHVHTLHAWLYAQQGQWHSLHQPKLSLAQPSSHAVPCHSNAGQCKWLVAPRKPSKKDVHVAGTGECAEQLLSGSRMGYYGVRTALMRRRPRSYLLAASFISLTNFSDMCLWDCLQAPPAPHIPTLSLSLSPLCPKTAPSKQHSTPPPPCSSRDCQDFSRDSPSALAAWLAPTLSWQRTMRLSRFVLVHRNRQPLCIDQPGNPGRSVRQKGCRGTNHGTSTLRLEEHGRC